MRFKINFSYTETFIKKKKRATNNRGPQNKKTNKKTDNSKIKPSEF